MKVGLPKAMITYEYHVLYTRFFELLGIEVVFSVDTNTKILNNGKKYSASETCLANKIYLGHVANLVERKDKEKTKKFKHSLTKVVSVDNRWPCYF